MARCGRKPEQDHKRALATEAEGAKLETANKGGGVARASALASAARACHGFDRATGDTAASDRHEPVARTSEEARREASATSSPGGC